MIEWEAKEEVYFNKKQRLKKQKQGKRDLDKNKRRDALLKKEEEAAEKDFESSRGKIGKIFFRKY